jgi:hypothetical protein
MKILFALVASLAAASAFAKSAERMPGPQPEFWMRSSGPQTTRLGAPLKGVRIGRVFTKPAPAIEH